MDDLENRRALPLAARERIRGWVMVRLSAGPNGGLRVPVAVLVAIIVLAVAVAAVVGWP